MASSSRLLVLSSVISEKTKVIYFLTSKGVEPPSFDVNCLAEYAISPNDTDAFDARLELIAATKELYALSHGPKDHIRNIFWDVSLYKNGNIEKIKLLLVQLGRPWTPCPSKPFGPSGFPRPSHLLAKFLTRTRPRKAIH